VSTISLDATDFWIKEDLKSNYMYVSSKYVNIFFVHSIPYIILNLNIGYTLEGHKIGHSNCNLFILCCKLINKEKPNTTGVGVARAIVLYKYM